MDLNSSIPQPKASSITKASTSLNEKLGKLISRQESECTIFRVHRHLREVNPSAYEPKVIAIGPYHSGKVHLKMMEDHKLRNLQSLLIKRKGCKIETFANAVGGLESEARKCYADQDFNLSESEFIEMLVLDGCFIIELVRNYEGLCSDHENKSMLRLGWMIVSLQRDLVLFENQIPFFILRELFDLIVGPHQHSQLLCLLSKFLNDFYPRKQCEQVANVAPHKIKHILDLVHHTLPPPSHSSTTLKEKEFQFITCATGLREANVKFEMKEEARMFDIEFKDGVMVMAPLLIGDDTECFLRNLIVYEQNFQHYPHNFVTDYVVFLDSLINSGKDVELLTRNGIIKNWQGDDEVVAKMVNRLCDSVVSHDDRLLHYYAQICKDVNEHCRKPWNRWMAKLRRNYLHSPWAIISILAAVVLLLLTLTQTVFSILQVVEKH